MKKIDVNNDNTFIYDESVDDIRDVIEKHLGKDGYFSDDIEFDDYIESTLIRVDVRIGDKFNYGCSSNNCYYRYFIPKDKCVFIEKEEKKLRPFKDISEFSNETGCETFGDTIHIRTKDCNVEYVLAYVGYRTKKDGTQTVYLGAMYGSFDNLFDEYEYYYNGEWLPFGVEDEN